MARKTATGKTPRKARKSLGKALSQAGEAGHKVPGPSPNAATNLLIADVAVRGAGIAFRHGLERLLLRARFSPEEAEEIVEGRTMGRSLVTHAAARVATRSLPGFLAVAGGLAAKAIVERSLANVKSRRAGDKPRKRKAKAGRGA